MSKIRLERRHDLGAGRVREIAEAIATDLGNQYGGNHHWEGSVLHFDRPGISGRLAVDDDRLTLDMELGLLMRPLRGRIETAVARRMNELLGTS